jgi:hypothetical protein
MVPKQCTNGDILPAKRHHESTRRDKNRDLADRRPAIHLRPVGTLRRGALPHVSFTALLYHGFLAVWREGGFEWDRRGQEGTPEDMSGHFFREKVLDGFQKNPRTKPKAQRSTRDQWNAQMLKDGTHAAPLELGRATRGFS